MQSFSMSPMGKTWILDLDGTLVQHNGPYINGHDRFLEGAKEFLQSIDPNDMIIFLTARSNFEKSHTLKFLKKHNIRYDHIIFNAPYGERILVNDKKPSGIEMAYAVNVDRDRFDEIRVSRDRKAAPGDYD